MYCGNCGKEIESSSTFCPECGAAIEDAHNISSKQDKQKIKKMMRLMLPVVMLIIIAFIGAKSYFYIQSIPSKEEIQRATNNVQNGALVASDGKWIYYNDSGLCKMLLKDGSRQSVISNDIYAEHMFFVGDSLFYYSFPDYYKLDGKVGKELGFSVFTENCIQFDGKKFYVTGSSNYDGRGVYSSKESNIKKGVKLSDIDPTQLFLWDEYLYVESGFGTIDNLPNKNYGTWRMNLNGNNLISIFDYCPRYLVFSGNRMYYTNEDNVICSANLDGSDEILFKGSRAGYGLNVSDDYVFYIDYDTENICRMDKDGSNEIELNNNRSGRLNIVDEWIFYENQDYDYEIYKMSFDGSYNQPIY